jgi:hypothetical protein
MLSASTTDKKTDESEKEIVISTLGIATQKLSTLEITSTPFNSPAPVSPPPDDKPIQPRPRASSDTPSPRTRTLQGLPISQLSDGELLKIEGIFKQGETELPGSTLTIKVTPATPTSAPSSSTPKPP